MTILRRIRLGTFNVNGKMPTQDLGAWVRVSDHDVDKLIPPLEKLPEITLGESNGEGGESRHRPLIPVVP